MNSPLRSPVYSVVNVFGLFSRKFSHIETDAFRHTVSRSTTEALRDTVPAVLLNLAMHHKPSSGTKETQSASKQ